jgi:hypothetical protein
MREQIKMMTGPLFTASGAQRVTTCGAPEAAAEAGEPWTEPERTVGFAAHQGTLIHAVAEDLTGRDIQPLSDPVDVSEIVRRLEDDGAIPAGLEFNLQSVEKRGRALAELVSERFPGDDYGITAEMKRAFSPWGSVTVGFTGYGAGSGEAPGHRDYGWVEDGDIAMTTDLEAWPEFDGGPIVVVDYKTGRRDNVTPARYNMQGLTAACAIRYGTHQTAQVKRGGHGPDPIRFELWFVDEGGSIEVDGWTYTNEEIEAAAVKLCETASRISSGIWPPVIGEHCTKNWCRYRQVCPAQGQALATISRKPVIIEPGSGLCEVTNNEQALRAIDVLPSIKKLTRELDAALKAYADSNEVTQDGKKTAGKTWQSKTSKSFAKLTPEGMVKLAEMTAGEVSLDEIAPRRLDRAALKAMPGGRGAEIMSALEATGDIIETETKRYGWRK